MKRPICRALTICCLAGCATVLALHGHLWGAVFFGLLTWEVL